MMNTKQTTKEERMARILHSNPQTDWDTLERSRQVEEQLAAGGIKLGGYRLDHALGGPIRPSDQPISRRANR